MEKLEYLKVLIDVQRVSGDSSAVEKRIVDVCNSIERDLDIKRGDSNE